MPQGAKIGRFHGVGREIHGGLAFAQQIPGAFCREPFMTVPGQQRQLASTVFRATFGHHGFLVPAQQTTDRVEQADIASGGEQAVIWRRGFGGGGSHECSLEMT